jgi:predicted RNA-binding protein YlqC (UPF0109 family)
MATIDEQFVEYIVKQLVSKPEAVQITRSTDERGVLLELIVDPEDIGRVIGKRGSTAQSLRTLLRALGTKNDARYNLKIVDIDRPEGAAPADAPAPVTDDEPADDVSVTDEPAAEEEADSADEPAADSDLAKKTRADLADLDDLDI